MKRTLVTTLAMLGLALQGCGGSICDDFESAINTVMEKGEDCFEAGEKEEFESFAGQLSDSCEEQVDELEGDEKEQAEKAVEEFKSCVDDLDDCSMDTRDAWSEDFNNCFGSLGAT